MFLKHVFTFSSISFGTRLFNMFREACFASIFGASHITDVFFYAVRFMSFFRSFFADGCVYGTLMPEISYEIVRKDKKGANDVARKFLSNMWFIALICLLLFEIFLPKFGPYIFKGYLNNTEKYNILLNLLRIIMPYLFFISTCTIYSSVQNALKRFWIQPSFRLIMDTTLFSSMMISYYIGFDYLQMIYILACTWTFAGFLQAIYCYAWCYQAGFTLKPQFFDWSKRQIDMLKRLIKIGLTSLNLHVAAVFDMLLASFLPKGQLTYLFLADKLNIIMIDFFGTSTSTVLLTDFSKLHNKPKKLTEALCNGVITTLELVLPIALICFCMSNLIIRVIYTHGNFNIVDCVNTAMAYKFYSAGMPAIVLTRILMSFFYAQRITYVPIISVVCVLGLIGVGNFLFLKKYGFLAMAGSNMIAAWIGVVIYTFFVLKNYPKVAFLKDLSRVLIWVAVHVVVISTFFYLLKVDPNNSILTNIFHLIFIIVAILSSYFGLGKKLKILGRRMPISH